MGLLFAISSFFLFVIAGFLSINKIEPFYTFYYIFAWWSYIIFVDGIIYILKGNSLILSRTKEFLIMLPTSTAFWLFFEIINIRLNNWKYINIPFDEKIRYIGYFISYSTVLPAIFETTELIQTLKIFKKIKVKALNIRQTYFSLFIYSGLAMFLLVLIFPQYFFPFTWIFLIFIIEPINYKLELTSLIKEVENAKWEKVFSLLLAGLICGIFWEMWNFKAGAKWIYNVPFVGKFKIFEMPLAGYLGFPVFAIECYSFYNLFSYLKKGITWEEERQKPWEKLKNLPEYYLYLLLAFFIPFYLLVFKLIDKNSVNLFILSL